MNRRKGFLILTAMLLLLCCAGCGRNGEPEVRRTESRNGQEREKGSCALPVYFRHDTSVNPDIAYVKAFAAEIQRVYNETYEGHWSLSDLKVKLTSIDQAAEAYYVWIYAKQERLCPIEEYPNIKGMYQAMADLKSEEEKKRAEKEIALWVKELEDWATQSLYGEDSSYWKGTFKIVGSLKLGYEIMVSSYSPEGDVWRPIEEEYSRENFLAGYEEGYQELLKWVK